MVAGTIGDCFSLRTCVIVVILRGILATCGRGYGRCTLGDCFSMRTCVIVVMLRGIFASCGYGRGTLGDCFSMRTCVTVLFSEDFFLQRFFCIKLVLRLDFQL